MPYEWVRRLDEAPEKSGAFSHAEGGPPAALLHLWPNRSLPKRGFVLFIALTCGLLALPLIAVLGSPVLWGLLPFFGLVVAGVWIALQRSYRDGEVLEELALWPDHIALTQRATGQAPKSWEANPHWVRIARYRTGGPVENYLTLSGGARQVELGAFLSPEEREELYQSLQQILAHLR